MKPISTYRENGLIVVKTLPVEYCYECIYFQDAGISCECTLDSSVNFSQPSKQSKIHEDCPVAEI